MATDRTGHRIDRLSVRKVPDALEQHPLISPRKVSLKTLGLTRWIAGIGRPLDHESRRRNCLDILEPSVQEIIP